VKALVGVTRHPGHALPALALVRALRERTHEVAVATAPRWRPAAEELGAQVLDPGERGGSAGIDAPLDSVADAAAALSGAISDAAFDVVVSDVLVPALALAAERAGARRATLLPVPYPEPVAGTPPAELGLLWPRTPVGSLLWRAGAPAARRRLPGASWLAGGRDGLNAIRRRLGLPALDRDDGTVTEGLTLVANLPQLEYPRPWPPNVHVAGAMIFDPEIEAVEPPPGDGPLVFVAASTERDPELRLVRTALEALAEEPVRVVASTGGRPALAAREIPDNAVVVDWAPYPQLMRAASLLVSQGGQGTLVRGLVEGLPVLVCPDAADMAGNGMRIVWAGAGTMLPRRLLGPLSLRTAVRRLLADPGPAARASEIAAWARANPGDARAAELTERHAAAGEAR
jgi:UDP:flavonoid glycosyltransferase YjiC (YdhE family)